LEGVKIIYPGPRARVETVKACSAYNHWGCSAPYISNSVASLISVTFVATAITSGQEYFVKFAGRQAGCANEGKISDGPVLRKIPFRRIVADNYCFAS
jgi:hypothetical protein